MNYKFNFVFFHLDIHIVYGCPKNDFFKIFYLAYLVAVSDDISPGTQYTLQSEMTAG